MENNNNKIKLLSKMQIKMNLGGYQLFVSPDPPDEGCIGQSLTDPKARTINLFLRLDTPQDEDEFTETVKHEFVHALLAEFKQTPIPQVEENLVNVLCRLIPTENLVK